MANPPPRSSTPAEDREPDTARTYERAKPEKESPGGKLGEDSPTPPKKEDRSQDAVTNKSEPQEDQDE